LLSIITYNVNGIRAAASKGFFEWLKLENPDIICLQEIKANTNQIDLNAIQSLGYYPIIVSAQKKGYSGVALLSKIKPGNIQTAMGIDAYDIEGRWASAVIKDTLFVSAYFPSGTTGDERQSFKYKFLNDVLPYSQMLIKEFKNIVISGDYNICHQPIDIHDPIGNKNSSGFLPEEREWMTQFFDSGWNDAFRMINTNPHYYTWWSYRAGARKNNKGWRIDYHAVSDSLSDKIIDCRILADVFHSDHCPVRLDLDI
jgi:exodeoxyribonuclease-3